jgi:hypothetical protein
MLPLQSRLNRRLVVEAHASHGDVDPVAVPAFPVFVQPVEAGRTTVSGRAPRAMEVRLKTEIERKYLFRYSLLVL